MTKSEEKDILKEEGIGIIGVKLEYEDGTVVKAGDTTELDKLLLCHICGEELGEYRLHPHKDNDEAWPKEIMYCPNCGDVSG